MKYDSMVKRIADKGAMVDPAPLVGVLTESDDLGFGLKGCDQVGIVACLQADEDLLTAAPDGPLYDFQITTYLLSDVALGAVAGNIEYEHTSSVVVHKKDGVIYFNNAKTGPFCPNAFLLVAFNNTVGLAEPKLTSF